jgi:hypothetical protein
VILELNYVLKAKTIIESIEIKIKKRNKQLKNGKLKFNKNKKLNVKVFPNYLGIQRKVPL